MSSAHGSHTSTHTTTPGFSRKSDTSATGKFSLISFPSLYALVLAIAEGLAGPALALLLLLVGALLLQRLAGLLGVVLLGHFVCHAPSMAPPTVTADAVMDVRRSAGRARGQRGRPR